MKGLAKKMSRVIDLSQGSDDNGESPNTNTASVPSPPLSRKRHRAKEGLSNGDHPRREHKKRRGGVVKSEQSAKCAQILKGVHATEKDVGSEDAHVADHGESHEGIAAAAAAASYPMNADPEQTSRNDGSAKKPSKKLSALRPPSNASRRQSRVSTAWKKRISELADYRKIHGHCNVPWRNSEDIKLANWVMTQRSQYKLHFKGKRSPMTRPRIQELESLGFEWGTRSHTAWEDSLSELANYRKIHGHCNVPKKCSENTKLAHWVMTQRRQYKLHLEGKASQITTLRIQELEGLGFEWNIYAAAWGDRLSELAHYHKIHGHCNVPKKDSENTKLAHWVGNQRRNYRLHVKGKTSPMTTFRIQALESLHFKWDRPKAITWKDRRCDSFSTTWKTRLSELDDYRKKHGHCNVPQRKSENTKLANWVSNQRKEYWLHAEGKKSHMTLPRIQELESFGFEWDSRGADWKDRLSELAHYCKKHGNCDVPQVYNGNTRLGRWVGTQRSNYRSYREGKTSPMTTLRIQALERLGFEWARLGATWEDRLRELADYRKSHGHCNAPKVYNESTSLGRWVSTQRSNYWSHMEGNRSYITPFRIQELESLGFEWKSSISRGKGKPKKPSLDDDATRVHERAVEATEHVQTTAQTQEDLSAREIRGNHVNVAFEPEEFDWNWNGGIHLGYIPGRTEEI
jgi:hypothetical protein